MVGNNQTSMSLTVKQRGHWCRCQLQKTSPEVTGCELRGSHRHLAMVKPKSNKPPAGNSAGALFAMVK